MTHGDPPIQQYQSNSTNSKYRHQPVTWPHPLFIPSITGLTGNGRWLRNSHTLQYLLLAFLTALSYICSKLCWISHWQTDWLIYGFTSHSTQNRSFWRHSSQLISWLSAEKLSQTQHKQTCIRNKIYCNIKWTQKKNKASFGYLL